MSGKASLSDVRRRIRDELKRLGTDPSLSFDCLLAVTEACTNALVHGWRTDSDERSPEVRWTISAGEARFEVQDFSTRQWSRATHPAGSAITEEIVPGWAARGTAGGFGITLMRELMDGVDINVGPTGTQVVMVKRLIATS